MLKEIKVNDLIKGTGFPTYFLYEDEGRLVALEDVFDGIRILVDVPEEHGAAPVTGCAYETVRKYIPASPEG